MPGSKIVNKSEALRWLAEGRTYAWMVEEYRRRYAIETTTAMWGNMRARRGLDRRNKAHVRTCVAWRRGLGDCRC